MSERSAASTTKAVAAAAVDSTEEPGALLPPLPPLLLLLQPSVMAIQLRRVEDDDSDANISMISNLIFIINLKRLSQLSRGVASWW